MLQTLVLIIVGILGFLCYIVDIRFLAYSKRGYKETMPDHLGVEPPTESSLGGLRLFLLGHPKIIKDSKPITISQKHVRLLLFYLAACDQMVSYEHLRYLFWPDIRDDVLQRNLMRLLNHINHCIGDLDLLLCNESHVQIDHRR
jgi:hypothetical protein